MRKSFALALAACLLGASAASADVKSGVDAWNQGDYGRAVERWRPLAVSGNADAQFNLGQAYKLGRGVTLDLPVALQWFRKASGNGHKKAWDNLGLLLFQQGSHAESLPYIKASSDRGEPRAQYVYATALFNGDGVPRDWVRAYALMTRASQSGVSQAAKSLAVMDAHIPENQRAHGRELAIVLARATPQPASAAPPRAAAARSAARIPTGPGRYRVQLGAFRDGARAPALWKTLRASVSDLSAFQPSYVATNGLTRLLVGPLATTVEAQQLCERIRPTGTPCVVQRM